MKVTLLALISTMVLVIPAKAAKKQILGDQLQLKELKQKSSESRAESEFSYELTPMAKPPVKTLDVDKPAYLTSNYSFSPHLSLGYSTKYDSAYGFGFQYLNFKSKWKSEYSFEIYHKGSASLSFSRKWFFFSFKEFQAHTKAGLGLYMNPNQGIATIVDFKNIGFNAQFGIEKIVSAPLSLRFDVDLFWGQREKLIMINSGYSWAW